jgi:methylmalonyl-CoA mutase cobalamin-binding subunit
MLETGRPYVVVVSVRDGHTEEHVYKIVAHVKGYGVDQAFVAGYEGPK